MIMSGLELLTAVREKVRLSVVVFNDGAYSLIRNAQLADYGASHGTEFLSPDFEALAAATGAEYLSVSDGDIARSLADAGRDGAGVRLIDVPLNDSPGLRRVRLKGRLRAVRRRLTWRRQRQ
jgi:acetolactate synthase-1/2/3 large subunit